jgi:hypothetical protein
MDVVQASDAAPAFDLDPASPIRIVPDPAQAASPDVEPDDPGELVLVCANCGARMDERKCKLICRCGYFLSCSDYT